MSGRDSQAELVTVMIKEREGERRGMFVECAYLPNTFGSRSICALAAHCLVESLKMDMIYAYHRCQSKLSVSDWGLTAILSSTESLVRRGDFQILASAGNTPSPRSALSMSACQNYHIGYS